MQALLILLLSVIPAAAEYGINYDVQVGADNQLTYWPEYVNAQPGDQVTFHL
jgi:plastocyanin